MLLFNLKAGGISGGHTFLKVISPKVNIIARQEIEPAYYDGVVQHFSNYATRTYLSFVSDFRR